MNKIVKLKSKARTVNPKDLLGNLKVSFSKLPAVGIIHGAHAMMNGADKYGAYNWRDKPVIASIYIDAAARHLLAWFEREQTAKDSGVHHLGHSIACAALLLDAEETGNLVDDRPEGSSEVVNNLLERLSVVIQAQREIRSKKLLAAQRLRTRRRNARTKRNTRTNKLGLKRGRSN